MSEVPLFVDNDSRTFRLSIMMKDKVTNNGKKTQPMKVVANTIIILTALELRLVLVGVCGGDNLLFIFRGGESGASSRRICIRFRLYCL